VSELPDGWLLTTIGEVADAESGSGFPKHMQGKTSGDYPFAKVSDISRAVAQANSDLYTAANYVDEADLKRLRAKPVPTGSIAFAKIGEALRLNRRAKVCKPLILDNNCMALVPRPGALVSSYLYRFMTTVDLSPYAVATAVPSVRKGDVEGIELPLPPLPEQRRIVEKLDALTARTAHARADLDRIPALAARYKQAVLAQLFNPDGLHAHAVPFFSVLDIKGGSQPPKSTFISQAAPGYIRLLQIRDFGTDDKAVFIRDETRWPKCTSDDIMVGRYGASVGKVLTGKEGAYNVALVKMIFDRKAIDRDFLFLWLQSSTFQDVLSSVSRSAQDGFNKGDLEAITFPMMPLVEQKVLAMQATASLADIDRMVTEAAASRRLLDRLDQAILAKAFRGELVPQDPSDEPASALLDRIRAERANAPKATRGRRKATAA